MRRSLLPAVLLFPVLSLPVLADSGLGIIGGELRLGFSNQELEGGYVGATVDVAITEHHGAQFDLQYEERATGGVGRLGTVVYMTPREGQKYGLSAMVADKNDISATYGQVGAAAMFEVAQGFNIELRGSIGVSTDNDMDWITAGGGLHWQATPGTRAYAHYDITEFDEETFDAVAHEATLGVQSRLNNTPASVFAEASRDWLTGQDAAAGQNTFRAGVSLSLGHTGNNQPAFRVADPMRQILRRKLY
ncbi:hypothetical protein Z945_2565 [Sulfitobacter noctilucae]|uniref:hypothetical protein n=1 Tax=Sulfitobacter noctilucae TaxID=1342302 RepID=UPI0004688D2E|nr:hypothetical protein [Sulfitobacter noctilucae]KIN61573.1 hypothetical protein Z945_2565 [Sulfitobacter noctilucae]